MFYCRIRPERDAKKTKKGRGYQPVLEHELERLAIQVARQVEAVDHVQLISAHVHKVLVQLEGPHVLRGEGPPRTVLLVPEMPLALAGRQRLPCAYAETGSPNLAGMKS